VSSLYLSFIVLFYFFILFFYSFLFFLLGLLFFVVFYRPPPPWLITTPPDGIPPALPPAHPPPPPPPPHSLPSPGAARRRPKWEVGWEMNHDRIVRLPSRGFGTKKEYFRPPFQPLPSFDCQRNRDRQEKKERK
jgi:hypothetical protein